ncbi:MAG: SUMF1/EgtB/PvdO family nonheme iron enzyme [Thermoguttaceae bacterium]|jgi:formylglycine-generating enzyme required for sulfatase activity
MKYTLNMMILAAAVAAASVLSAQASTITMDMVTVGDPGNVADTTGYGAVGYVYEMGKYDVTTTQYTAFLNAVAKTSDPYGLYNSDMTTVFPNLWGVNLGIARSGSPGNYSYSVIGSGNVPVVDVTWGDAARFANWLQNGQPSGPGTIEAPGTTETGAYTLSGDVSSLMEARNPGATYFIPSENEWYKSAYYKGGSTNAGYWQYPTKSNTAPSNVLSASGTNNANFYNNGYTDPTNYLTPVGYFAGSPGPYGTYDQGGDVYQWNEGPSRGLRGGSFPFDSSNLASSTRGGTNPTYETYYIGFRVAGSAASPEPGGVAMLLAGALAFGIWRLRRNA